MYKRDGIFQTKNISVGNNSHVFIILHDTGVIGRGNLPYLLGSPGSRGSAHILINRDGKAYKLAEPTQITRHAGESRWGKLKFMNKYAIGIEIEGNGDTPYPEIQYKKAVDVIKHLASGFNIPCDHILKHSDITRAGSIKEQLWDGKTPSRKPDLTRNFWADRGYKNFKEWREENFK